MRPENDPLQRERERYDRFRSQFSASYMSDAKWRKVLSAIASADLGLKWAVWKFIDSDRLYDWGVPPLRDILPSRLADGNCQPVEYRWIEWIYFPHRCRPDAPPGRTATQDLAGLSRLLATLGSLQVAQDDTGIRIYGYTR